MPRSTFSAAAMVVVTGLGLGFAANALSPRGLSLSRNYFPDTPAASPVLRSQAPPEIPPAATPHRTKRGLPLIDHARAAALFRDARHAQGRVLFIDARNEEAYRQGHIPGAHILDHYHVERHLADLIAPAALAEEIVVYCNGGECEDSDLAAFDLVQVGVPESKLLIYAGGIAGWKTQREPVELGARGSGELRSP